MSNLQLAYDAWALYDQVVPGTPTRFGKPPVVVVSGQYGPNTAVAIQYFQVAYNFAHAQFLLENGVADQATLDALSFEIERFGLGSLVVDETGVHYSASDKARQLFTKLAAPGTVPSSGARGGGFNWIGLLGGAVTAYAAYRLVKSFEPRGV